MAATLKLVILGATGGTGRELVRQALARGHDVTALARDPSRIESSATGVLHRIKADVRDPASIAAAIGPSSTVLSALGATGGDSGVLSAGARALEAAGAGRILWLGAYGTGPSARAAGWATRALLSLMGARLADKVQADALVLGLGGVVFHAGPLSDAGISASRRTVPLRDAPRRFFPARVSRATVAAAMLDEAEQLRFQGEVAIPLAG